MGDNEIFNFFSGIVIVSICAATVAGYVYMFFEFPLIVIPLTFFALLFGI